LIIRALILFRISWLEFSVFLYLFFVVVFYDLGIDQENHFLADIG
jgi:hypothetical protein